MYEWADHTNDNCDVCRYITQLKRGGRPKKPKKTGRPPRVSTMSVQEHIRSIAPTSVIKNSVTYTQTSKYTSVVTCPVCCDVLDLPIELSTCGTTICAECCCSWVRISQSLKCPCCYSTHLGDFHTIPPASSLVRMVLEDLDIECEKCGQTLQAKTYDQHITNGCVGKSTTMIQGILQMPTDTPLTPLEQRLQCTLVKRSLNTSDQSVLRVKTGGQVNAYKHINRLYYFLIYT